MANLFDFTTPKAFWTPFQLKNTFSELSPTSIQKAAELPKNTAFDDYMQASYISKEWKRKLLSDLQSGKITQEQADKIASDVLNTPDTRLNTSESIAEWAVWAFRVWEQIPRYIGNIGKVLSDAYQLPYEASKNLFWEEAWLTSFLAPGAAAFKKSWEAGQKLWEEITMAWMTDGGTNKLTPEQISARKTWADIVSTSILPAGNIANIWKWATLAQMIKSWAKIWAVTTPQFYAMTEWRLPTAWEMVAWTAGWAIITPAIGKAIKYGTALTKWGISWAWKSISRDVSSIWIPWKETATRAIPTKIVWWQLWFTPTERAKIEKIVWTDEATYLLNKWLAGQSKEQLAEHFMKQSDEMYNGITQKLAKVDKRVESNSAKEALQDILDQLESKPKFKRAYAKDIAAAKKMLESGEYSLSELNNIRRAYDKVNTGMYTAQWAARSGIENDIDIRVRNALSEQIQKEAKLAGVDVKEMNKELRAGLVMKDAILRRLSQEQRNNFIGLQDLWVSAILSGGNPATAAATILTKKYIESIAPTVAQKLYNLNKAQYVPRTVTRGNTISPRNKSSILNLAGSTVTPVASKQVKAPKLTTETPLLSAPKPQPKGTWPIRTTKDQAIIAESKKELNKTIISNKTTNDKSKVMNDWTNSKSDVVPEGYFKNVFGEIVKNPRNKNKGSLNIGQIAEDIWLIKKEQTKIDPFRKWTRENYFDWDTEQVARERFNIDKLKLLSKWWSDRDVYDLWDWKVLKISKTARWLKQNQSANDYYLQQEWIIPETFEYGKNYVVSEKIKTWTELTTEERKILNDFQKWMKKVESDFRKNYWLWEESQTFLEDNWWSALRDYDLNDFWWADVSLRNLGIKNWKPILVDEWSIWLVSTIKEYSKLKNLDDPTFREIYNESKQLKKKFWDLDKNTMYNIAWFVIAGSVLNKLLSNENK